MDYPSPVFTPRKFNHGQKSTTYTSPFQSPTGAASESPDFIPFNFSSPLKMGHQGNRKGGRRYFNNSNNSFNSSSSGYSPFNRGKRNFNRHSNSPNQPNVSINQYYDPTVLDDPWADLESEYVKKKEEASKSVET